MNKKIIPIIVLAVILSLDIGLVVAILPHKVVLIKLQSKQLGHAQCIQIFSFLSLVNVQYVLWT